MSVDVVVKMTGALKGGLKTGVATELNAVDFVDSPAAAGSLFSKPVDSNTLDKEYLQMALSKEEMEKKEKEEMEAKDKKDKEELSAKLSKFEVLFEWCSKKMAEEKAKDSETDDEKKKKKMESEVESLKLAKQERDKEIETVAARVLMDTLKTCGIEPKTSKPAEDGKNEPQLNAEELKLAKLIGIDTKQFAANLASLPKENRLTLAK
jgi:ATP-dependent Clp protease ATP-binding subunit ClpA